MKKVLFVFLCCLIFLIFTINSNAETADNEIILIGGITTQEAFVDATQTAFEKASGLKLKITGISHGVGIKSLLAGKCDLAMISSKLTEEEKSQGLQEFIIGLEPLLICINEKNPIKNLTTEQLKSIFLGEKTNWKDFGGNDQAIIIYVRTLESAPYKYLKTKILDNKDWTNTAIVVKTFKDVTNKISTNVGAISIVPNSWASDAKNIKSIYIDGIAPSKENVLSGKYKHMSPVGLASKGELSEKAQKYIDWLKKDAEAQKILNKRIVVK